MRNNYCSVIVIRMPDGVNYYCGKVKFEGNFLDEWDTDITFAILYYNKRVAKKRCSILKMAKGQSDAKVKDFYRLPLAEQQKRNSLHKVK